MRLSKYIAIATCIRTNQNPNSVRRREAPPHTIWVFFFPYTGGYIYIFGLKHKVVNIKWQLGHVLEAVALAV
ncbi:MAG: hypothetical protein ACK56L_00980, partial [Pseudanabaena sp.]